ncbi:MAG: class I SAM-dependent methyltransferase [Candidatus Omnitrophota bacterium]|jgi:ubiquinone/menaquinone biosynthesis C-methylase UbiE
MKTAMAGAVKNNKKILNDLAIWESDIYGKGKQHNKYTWGEVYYYTNRYFLSQHSKVKGMNVLELGSGTGNNLVYFAGLGMNVYGIEASSTASSIARDRLTKFKNIKSEIICGNFCEQPLPFKSGFFDLILDRGSITHNVLKDIKKVIGESYRMLKSGGMMISIHFFSNKDSRCNNGVKVETGTFKGMGGYAFADVPLVHFSNPEEIRALYKRFNIKFIEEKFAMRHYPYAGEEKSASFDIIAAK